MLRLHNKFSIIQYLDEKEQEYEQEQAYSKVRMQRKKEMEEMERRKREKEEEMNDNQIEAPLLEVYETEDIKRRQEEREEEDDAKTRQTFDPINNVYDDRKRRVTDLAECSRVTLPKPMQIEEEALIEIRRNMHKKIFSQHREENTDNGKQESNLSEEERKGLRSILKRIREGEILVMKTDKSGKFCIVSQADYIKMGEVHTKNDKKISRDNVIQIEKAQWSLHGLVQDMGYRQRSQT